MNNHFIKAVPLFMVALTAGCQSKPVEPHRPPAAAPPAPAETVHVNPHFRITLPVGWRVAASQPEPTERLGVYSDGVIALKAAGPNGYFLEVWFECPGTEVSQDSRWRAIADGAYGRGVVHVEEKDEACTQEAAKECVKRYRDDPNALGPGPEYCHCSVGDGRLEIWAHFDGQLTFRDSSGMCFRLGNTSNEGADRAPLRAILKTFELVGAVGLPQPTLPLPKAMQEALDESTRKGREGQGQGR